VVFFLRCPGRPIGQERPLSGPNPGSPGPQSPICSSMIIGFMYATIFSFSSLLCGRPTSNVSPRPEPEWLSDAQEFLSISYLALPHGILCFLIGLFVWVFILVVNFVPSRSSNSARENRYKVGTCRGAQYGTLARSIRRPPASACCPLPGVPAYLDNVPTSNLSPSCWPSRLAGVGHRLGAQTSVKTCVNGILSCEDAYNVGRLVTLARHDSALDTMTIAKTRSADLTARFDIIPNISHQCLPTRARYFSVSTRNSHWTSLANPAS